MNKVDEVNLLEKRIMKKEAELIEVKEWINNNNLTPVPILVTLIEGQVAKQADIEKYKKRIEELKK
jgi:hypothetical protein